MNKNKIDKIVRIGLDECAHERTTPKRVKEYQYSPFPSLTVVFRHVGLVSCVKCKQLLVPFEVLQQWDSMVQKYLMALNRALNRREFAFLRQRLGLRPSEFASLIHVDKSTVSKWESGQSPIPVWADELVRLLLNVPNEERKRLVHRYTKFQDPLDEGTVRVLDAAEVKSIIAEDVLAIT